MTLATLARIILDPRSILQKKEAHDLAHAFVRARREAERGRVGTSVRRQRARSHR